MSKAFRYRLENAAVGGVTRIVRALPRGAALAVGDLIGFLFYMVDGVHRRIAVKNLEHAFPRYAPHEHRAIARATFQHFGRLLVDLLTFSSLPPERMLSLVEWEGEDRVRHAYAQGRGVLFFTGHFGCWEIQAIAHGLYFHAIAVVARALDNPELNAMLERVRGVTGNRVIYRRGSVRAVLRALQNGEGVALLIDQHIQPKEAVYVDFFERPVATTPALAALALRTGAPVIPVFAMPLPDGRYRLIYDHPVEPPTGSDDAVREFTQRCTDVLEMYVRRRPQLWLWMHRRWRDTEASAEQAPGMFPAGGDDANGAHAGAAGATAGPQPPAPIPDP